MRVVSKAFETTKKLFELEETERAFLMWAFALAPVAARTLRGVGAIAALGLLARRRSLLPRKVGSEHGVSAERGEQLVSAAFARHPANGTCLPTAMVQFALHRRFGPTPRFVIGVQKRAADSLLADIDWTMGAHAWIEPADGPARNFGFAPLLSYTDRDGIQRCEAQ